MNKELIVKQLREMAKHPTVTLPRDCEILKAAADLIEQAQKQNIESIALEMLEHFYSYGFDRVTCEKAIVAIKESLSQKNPVAFICQGNVYMADDVDEYCNAKHIPLYTKEQL